MAWLLRQRRAEATTSATIENSTSMASFHCDGESANRPKAAPRFSTWVRRKKPGINWMPSCSEIFVATSHLVARSSNTTAIAMTKWNLRITWRSVIDDFTILNRSDRENVGRLPQRGKRGLRRPGGYAILLLNS